ncbi:MAG: hypothetical protein IPO93_04270 [Actinobacteria bacterium]|nr:hypothetical protein [Actinomycetota bacterium]
MTADLTERAFVGALMHLAPERVIRLAGLVRATDLADPRLQIVYAGIVRVAATGAQPDPAVVDAHLRTTGSIRTTDRAAVVSLIVDLFTEVPLPAAAESYARAVVEEAVRRRVLEASERLRQAADGSGLDTLAAVVEIESVALADEIARLTVGPLAGAA